MKCSKFRMTAYPAEPSSMGCVAISVCQPIQRKTVECTLADMPAIAQAFANECKPQSKMPGCAVWVGVEGRAPNGFKKAKCEYLAM